MLENSNETAPAAPHDLSGSPLSSLRSDSALFGSLALPDHRENFYSSSIRALNPLFGSHEHAAYDFNAAMRDLNARCALGLSADDAAALAMMLTGLTQTPRFKGEIHLEPRYGENTAVHSGHCVLLASDMFRRARLTKPEDQTPEVRALHNALTLGCLVHDMGEVLGEFTTLSQRAHNQSLCEVPEVERRIFGAALRYACFAAQENDPGIFYRAISHLRDCGRIGAAEPLSTSELQQLLDSDEAATRSMVQLAPAAEARHARFMRIFDIVEMRNSVESTPTEQFIAHAVKVIEHTQGIRHLVRFCTKGADYAPIVEFRTPTLPSERADGLPRNGAGESRESLPLSLMPSYRMRRGLDYLESGIPEMFAAARTEVQQKIARAVRDACYETTVEWFNACNPYFDRSAAAVPPGIVALCKDIRGGDLRKSERTDLLGRAAAELHALSNTLESRHAADPHRFATDRLLDVESNERMMSLYLHARKMDYTPPLGAPPLALLTELPPELKGFPLVDWSVRRRHRASAAERSAAFG